MKNDKTKNYSYIAIVIAAGMSSRMGEFKPLLDIGERSALTCLLDSIRSAGIRQTLVVTGYKRELIKKELEQYSAFCMGKDSLKKDGRNDEYCLSSINNEAYREGMFSSIKAGIRHVAGLQHDADPGKVTGSNEAALLFPVDVPLVSAETIKGLIRNWEESSLMKVPGSGNVFAVPVFKGKNGHPLLIPNTHFDEIIKYDGEGGLKGVRNRHEADMIRYAVDDEGCVLDMDTPDDYMRILEYYEKQRL